MLNYSCKEPGITAVCDLLTSYVTLKEAAMLLSLLLVSNGMWSHDCPTLENMTGWPSDVGRQVW